MKKKGSGKSSATASSSSSRPKSSVPEADDGSMEDVQRVLQLFESSCTAAVSKQDTERAVRVLQQHYKMISVRNKVDSRREELLQQEIADLQRRNVESTDEIRALQEQFRTSELKVEKLENLSRVLSGRVKSVESKASDDVKYEKEDRLRLSYEFSAKIKEISVKLDQLGKRREAILTENARLKQVLRSCFQEFNSDPELSGEGSEGKETERAASTADGVDSDAELEPEEKVRRRESTVMEHEDDNSRTLLLREKEELLRRQSTKFMEVFDSFQQRLTESNHLFKLKQSRVEDVTKDIKATEKTNNELTSRIAECSVSSAAILEAIDKTKSEKDKLSKLLEKQRSLIDKFQADIAALQGGL